MLLAKVAKHGDYVHYAEHGSLEKGTIWRVLCIDKGRVCVRPACQFSKEDCKNSLRPKYPDLVLCEKTKVLSGEGSKHCPYEVE